MENDLAHLRSEIVRLSQETTELRAGYENLEQKNEEMVSEIAQVEQDNVRINNEIKQVKNQLERERQASQQVNDRLAQLNQELESHKTRLMDLVAQEAQYKNIYQNAASNKESLHRRLKRAEEEEALAKKQIATIEKQETEANAHLNDVIREIADLAEHISDVRTHLEERSQTLGKQAKHIQTLELERTKTHSKLSTLQKMEDSFEWYRDGVRALMKAQSAKRKVKSAKGADQSAQLPEISQELSDNILGLMADIVEAEPSYEIAVEAALGEALQYIIVKDQQTGSKAIDYLQTQHAGRSGFIPIASIKQVAENQLKPAQNSSLLLQHITVKSGFEKIADALLGHVVFTTSLTEALELFNRNGALQTIVTQNGDLITPQGVMLGGSKDKLNGILAKKLEIRELQRHVKDLDQKIDKARDYQYELDANVRDLENQLQQQIEQHHEATQNEIDAEKAVYKISEDLKNARRHFEIVSLEQEQLLGETSDIDAEMTQHNKLLAKLSDEIQAVQQTSKELAQKIAEFSGEMEDFNQKVVDLKLKLTALNAKLENSNTTLRRLTEFYEDSQKRLEQLNQEIKLKADKEKSSTQKIAEYEQRLSEMYREMERLDHNLQLNEADFQAIDDELRDSDSLISNLQSKRQKSLEKFRLLELELSQLHIKRDNVVNRIEERYQSSFSDIRSQFNDQYQDEEISSETPIEELEAELSRYREKIAKIIDVNLGAIREYEQLKDRYDFLEAQRQDLVKAIEDLHKVINKINKVTQERFMKTFNRINDKLKEVFPRLFEGGTANLILTEPSKPLETGVEFMIHLPGKKLTRLSLLSGGEKALSAIAFIFAIFLIRPASFCLLDEIDAPLDDANILRFNDLLQIIGENSQIIMITHNKRTMEFADTLFGITMEEKGLSKLVSVKFDRAPQAVAV